MHTGRIVHIRMNTYLLTLKIRYVLNFHPSDVTMWLAWFHDGPCCCSISLTYTKVTVLAQPRLPYPAHISYQRVVPPCRYAPTSNYLAQLVRASNTVSCHIICVLAAGAFFFSKPAVF